MFFGLARGLLIVMVLVAAGGMTSAPQQPWWVRRRWRRLWKQPCWQPNPGCRTIGKANSIQLGRKDYVRDSWCVATSPVNQLLYDGLMVLQHRGQDAAGIATAEGNTFNLHKGPGLVRDVFRTRNMRALPGNWASAMCATRPPVPPTTLPRRSPFTSIRRSASCSATTAT
jgi:hypothetical protein